MGDGAGVPLGKMKPILPPAPPGLSDFWATVHVKLAIPIADENDPSATPTQGYYRNFGIRAAPDRVATVLRSSVADGTIDWDDTEFDLVVVETLERAVRKRIEPTEGEGIWYKSARVFYADPDLEPIPS